VFASRQDENIVNRHYKPLHERASLSPLRFHDLRRSRLSLLTPRGEPIRDVQALAGHATAAFTLQRYAHQYGSSSKGTADAIDDTLPDAPWTAALDERPPSVAMSPMGLTIPWAIPHPYSSPPSRLLTRSRLEFIESRDGTYDEPFSRSTISLAIRFRESIDNDRRSWAFSMS
jgi:hypothetical protein